MNFFVITLFSFTLALHLFILDATFIALLGRPSIWEAEHHLEVDYETCCQEMCRSNDSCKSYDQTWQPWRDIYECRFYSKNYQVLKAEGGTLELLPRVQYFSKMFVMTSCIDWYVYGGARSHNIIYYPMKSGTTTITTHQCSFKFYSCNDLVHAGLLKENEDEGVYSIFIEGFEESAEDFWLGNELLHKMTKDKDNELVSGVILQDGFWNGDIRDEFNVDSEATGYKLNVGEPSYDVTPIFKEGLNTGFDKRQHEFITYDRDGSVQKCASTTMYNGEGIAGWGQPDGKCSEHYTTYFNAKVPKRHPNSLNEIVEFKGSLIMFRDKDDVTQQNSGFP